ncbi:MAG: hypothetical protein ACRYFS_20360 [Janthinobacterium lividum]
MNISIKPNGTDTHSPNPILVAFFQEVRRLSEEVTRREEAAGARSCTNSAAEQSRDYNPNPQPPARRFAFAVSDPASSGNLYAAEA